MFARRSEQGNPRPAIQLFITEDSQTITVEFHDQTSLSLEMQSSLATKARFYRDMKGEPETLAK